MAAKSPEAGSNHDLLAKFEAHKISLWVRAGKAMFMGRPDDWFEKWTVVCTAGHVSTRVLKSTATGKSLCLECGCECVIMAPPGTSERFVMSMLCGKRLRPVGG